MIKIEIKWYEDFVNRLWHLVADDTTNKAIKLSMFEIQREAQIRTPLDTGNLRGSYETKFWELEWELRNTRKYWIFVHEGRWPWPIPLRAIEPWARRKGINPYVVKKSIQKKWTKGQPWMTQTAEAMQGKVNFIFNSEFQKLFKRLSN